MENGRVHLKLVKPTRHAGAPWTGYHGHVPSPWCSIIAMNVHGAPSSENIYFVKFHYP